MRTAFAAAAFVAGALAVPAPNHRHLHKRAEVVEYDYVTVTNVVTVTAGVTTAQAAATSVVTTTAAPESTTSSSRKWNHWWTWTQTWKPQPTTTEAPSSAPPASSAEPTSAPPAPSSYKAPSPSTTEAPETTSEAPETTTEAPTTTAAPTTSTWTSAKPTTKATTPASSASDSAPTSYSGKAVLHHNIHRSNHSAPDIEWDDALASTAQKIAESCVYAHNTDMDGGGYGQNIAAGVEADNITAIITDLFYNGEVGWYDNLYGEAQPDMTNFEHWGHFSQIVWKDTTKVGCYTQTCGTLQNVGSDVPPYFTVCNYGPPGNYANEYGSNVGKPIGDKTAAWNQGL